MPQRKASNAGRRPVVRGPLIPDLAELRRRVPQTHPRLHFPGNGLRDLAERLDQPPFTQHYAEVLQLADRFLGQTLPRVEVPAEFYASYRAQSPEAVKQHYDVQGPVERNMETLRTSSLVYRVTGRREYFEQARQALLALAAIDTAGTSYRITHCFCHLIPAISIGLDWLWDDLAAAERDLVVSALLRRTRDFFPLSLLVAMDSPLDSHAWEYGIFGMTHAALCLFGQVPEAEEWLLTVLRFLDRSFPGFGGDDGGWGQGLGYVADLDVQLVMHLLYLGTGVNFFASAWGRNNGNSRLYFQSPYSVGTAFGDAAYLPRPGLQKQVMEIYAMATQNPYYQWYADQIEAPYFGGGYFFSHEYFLSHFLHWSTPQAKPPTDLPQSLHLRDVDWVAMHTALADRERNVALLFKSSHFGSFNHSHADQNSFVLEAFGQSLLIDSGYYPWYGSRHDVNWTRQSRAHNVVLINGKGQGVWNRRAAGRIVAYVDNDEVVYSAGDATAAYQQPSLGAPLELCAAHEGVVRAIRHIAFCRPDVIVILDDLQTEKPAEIQFLLHALEPFRVDGAPRQATLVSGAALARVSFLGSHPLTVTQTDQFSDPPERISAADTDQRALGNQWHLTAQMSATTAVRRLLTVIQVCRAEAVAGLPPAELLEEFRTLGARVGSVEVRFRLNPATVTMTCQRRGPRGELSNTVCAGPPTA
jgi:hypothetical protein